MLGRGPRAFRNVLRRSREEQEAGGRGQKAVGRKWSRFVTGSIPAEDFGRCGGRNLRLRHVEARPGEVLLLRGPCSKADRFALAGGCRHQLSYCRDGGGYGLVVCSNFSFQLSELCGQLFVLQGGFAQLDESANDKDAHPHSPLAAPARWPP
jgi:hypothetical protein